MKYRLSEEIGKVDEKYIEEVFKYQEKISERSKARRIGILRAAAAAAACAVIAFGAAICFYSGRVPKENEPQISTSEDIRENAPDKSSTPIISGETEPQDNAGDIVEVEHSYNERIASGEDVRIETHIDERIEHQGFAYTLKDITVSPTFPEGITKDQIDYYPVVAAYYDEPESSDWEPDPILGFYDKVYDYDTYAAEHGMELIDQEEADRIYPHEGKFSRALTVGDVIDENGLYQGPMDVPDESYRWIFLKIEIENLTDEKQLEYMADMDLCGGKYIEHPITASKIIDGEPVWEPAPYSFYAYETGICYMNEHTEEEIYDGQADLKKFHNLSFEPGEIKTMVLGYCVSDHFVFGELFLNLHNSEPTESDGYVYLPLK